MRLAAVLVAALFIPAAGHATEAPSPAPFAASWERCGTLHGASVCTWMTMRQNGTRVCAVREDFATNAYYTHRLTGTADGNRVHFDQICGDPGSETETFCAGSAPEGEVNVGWGAYDRTLSVCDGLLSEGAAACTGEPDDAAMTNVPADSLPLSEEDLAWLNACEGGLE
jgi:hypothetical protein